MAKGKAAPRRSVVDVDVGGGLVTAKDVAADLGVAISTVGRAMSDDPRISRETKNRVLLAAERMGYVGNNPAKIIRGGSSNLIGLIIPDVRSDFFASIAQSLSDCLDERGYRLVLSLCRDDREVEARQLKEMVGARAAGVILVPTTDPKRETKALLATVPHAQFLRHVPSCGNIWFGVNDEQAALDATQHLIGAGHKRIGYIGGFARLSTGRDRLAGYKRALIQAGITPDERLIDLGETSVEAGVAAARRLLRSKHAPTALLPSSVNITMGVLQVLDEVKVSVPADMSVVGFGDSTIFGWWREGLTMVAAPMDQLATTCGLWFLNYLKTDRQAQAKMEHFSSTPLKLVIRRSVAAPRTKGRLLP